MASRKHKLTAWQQRQIRYLSRVGYDHNRIAEIMRVRADAAHAVIRNLKSVETVRYNRCTECGAAVVDICVGCAAKAYRAVCEDLGLPEGCPRDPEKDIHPRVIRAHTKRINKERERPPIPSYQGGS